jgi:RNA polymerase sigma-70 factor (ECF subfamily)
MTLLRQRDVQALRALIERHGAELARFFALKSGDEFAAQELVNETFYRIFAKASTFDPSKPFRPWLYAVAANVWRARQRKRRLPEVSLEQVPEPTRPDPADASADGAEEAAGVLGALSEIDREILVLKHYEGMKLKDIAARLGLTPGAVYTRLFRAVRRLRATPDANPR